MYEAQLAQLTQQTFNIESTALATENLRNTMVTLDAMSQANKELRKQYGKIDIGKIEVRALLRDGHVVFDANLLVIVEYAIRHGGAFGAGERSPRVAESILCRPGRD
jgi:hypothetical protein